MKIVSFLLIILQALLIGFAAFVIAGGFGQASPFLVATQVACIAINVAGIIINAKVLSS